MDEVLRSVRALLDDTRATLEAAGARDEALGEYVRPRPVLGIRRDPTMRDLGRVWRLGTLLLHRDGSLWATGSITRVTEPGRPQYQSTSAEIRRAYRAAANKGHFRTGDTVNHGARPITIDEHLVGASGPVFIDGDRALVRWSPTASDDAAVPLTDYLTDRVELLVHPPQGA
ncbi:hypothetical protein [Curtobacterium sp. RRHDQ10]|uniref:hypothetical protein n=1 Tax=Curtobacterium phyllosphaerae TaxID=3413379 RepID=UPI003BEF7A81